MHCRVCGGHRADVGSISWTGKCRNCGLERHVAVVGSIMDHQGEGFEYWRLRCAASVGAIPLDLIDTYLEQRQRRE
jgi:hypothetical protein